MAAALGFSGCLCDQMMVRIDEQRALADADQVKDSIVSCNLLQRAVIILTSIQDNSKNGRQLPHSGGGRSLSDPSAFLGACWMARYYGMILPPEVKDGQLLNVEKRGLQLGAKP